MRTNISRNLPRLVAEMHIAPFNEGRTGVECFLVETRDGAFLVNQQMRCLLEALVEQSSITGVRAQLEASLGKSIDEAEVSAAIAGLPKAVFQEGGRPPGKTPFHFSFRLLSAATVQKFAARIRRLCSPMMVVAVVALLLLELPWLVRGVTPCVGTPLDPTGVLWLLAGTCLIALLHELGHAAACAWYGLRPGEIGFGLYLLFPAFFTDVTKAWRLRPMRRAAVDAGGMYFQLILIVLAVPLAHGLGDDRRIFTLLLYNLYLIFHNLNPLFKMDGYWIFSDLAGLPNLHKRTWQVFRQAFRRGEKSSRGFPWEEKKKTLILLHAYALAVLAYGIFALAALPRWFAAQLQPYPAVASARLHSMAEEWAAADYRSFSAEGGALACASLLPALVLALLVSWISRIVKRVLAKHKTA